MKLFYYKYKYQWSDSTQGGEAIKKNTEGGHYKKPEGRPLQEKGKEARTRKKEKKQ